MTTDVTTKDERLVVEQSSTSVVVLSSDQIVTVIEQLHACYDYCAAWKEPTLEGDQAVQEQDDAQQEEHRADEEQAPAEMTGTKR